MMGQSFTTNLHCVNYKQSHCIIQPQGAVFRGWFPHLWVAGWGKGQSLVVVWLGAFSVVMLESGLLDYDGKSLQWWEQLYASSIYRFGEFVFFVLLGCFVCFKELFHMRIQWIYLVHLSIFALIQWPSVYIYLSW